MKSLSDKEYFSESGQDKFIENLIKKKSITKVLMEAGAYDPKHLSNSRHFVGLHWQTILVEPNSKHYQALRNEYQGKREIKIFPNLLSDANYQGYLDPGNDSFTALWSEGKTGFPVRAMTIKQVLTSAKVKSFGILFLDTEGTEPKILRRMLFDNVFPSIICVENHNESNMFENILNNKYKKLAHLGYDDILIKI